MSEINITNEILIDELQKRFSKYQNTLKELKKVNDDLNTVNIKLTESEKLKSHFLSNIANEIINPFTAIIGASQMILEAKPTDFDFAQKMAQNIYNEASYLDFQLKNIFAAAEIEAGGVSPMYSKMNILETVCSLKERYENLAKDKNIELNINNKTETEEYYIIGDNEKISLIVSNFLNNAIKFSYENSKIEICTYKEDVKICISVKDNGEGISEEKKQIIFDRFNRVKDNINSLERGSGLGLSISNYYAELLESEISFVSNKNEGSQFILKLNQEVEDINSLSIDDNQIFFDDMETF